MFSFLIFLTLSEFQPDQAVNCLRDIKCPDTIDEIIISISKRQYCGCQYPTSKVKIDESIEIIPSYSFYGSTIQELKLHSNIQYIDEGAFGNCSINLNLSEITNLQVIGDGSFYMSKIPPVLILPDNLNIIGSYAFANVTTIKKSIINAKIIKSYAFFGCYNMNAEKIQIAGSGSIYDHAFHDCYQLKGTLIINEACEKDINNNFIYSNLGISAFQNSGIRILKLPQLNEIGSYCFYNCCQLMKYSIIIAEKIGDFVFELSPNLHIQTKNDKFNGNKIPNKYNQNMFSKLTKDIIDRGKCGDNADYIINTFKHIITITGSGPMYNNFNYFRQYQDYIWRVEFIGSVTSVGSHSFKDFSNLENIDFSRNTITQISESAFENCKNLMRVSLNSNLNHIGKYAFYKCESLTSIIIPENVNRIDTGAFAQTALESVVILSNNIFVSSPFSHKYSFAKMEVTYIGNQIAVIYSIEAIKNSVLYYPFYYDQINYQGSISRCVFLGKCGDNLKWLFNADTKTIYIYGYGDMNDYKSSSETPWNFFKPFIEKVIITDSVTSIGENSFRSCLNLKYAEISGNVKYIGPHAFSNCPIFNVILYDKYHRQTTAECSSTALVEKESDEIPEYFSVFSYNGYSLCNIKNIIYNLSSIPNFTQYKPDLSKTAEYYYLITIAHNEIKSRPLIKDITRYKAVVEIFVLYAHYFLIDYFYDITFRPINNSIFDFIRGSLYLNLDKSDNFTIILNDSERLGITGNGKIIFKQRVSNSSITFTYDFSINGQLKLIIPNEVNSIIFDSDLYLNLESSLVVEHENKKGIINVVCNKIIAEPKSISIISKMTIRKRMFINQYSKIKLENVVFDENLAIYFIIYNYDKLGFESINIIGNCSYPKSFDFSGKHIPNSNPIYDTDYVLISGFSNQNDCQKWLDVINLNNSRFDSKRCQDQKIVIRASSDALKKHFGINEKIGLGLGCVGFPILICAIIYHCIFTYRQKGQVEKSNSLSE